MLCPKCNSATSVIGTHHFTDGIRRRHACRNKECGYRFNTAQVIYGKPFAVCKGKRMRRIEGKWVTAKSVREMELHVLRAKRARFTKEERLEFIRRSLFKNRSDVMIPDQGDAEHG